MRWRYYKTLIDVEGQLAVDCVKYRNGKGRSQTYPEFVVHLVLGSPSRVLIQTPPSIHIFYF